MQPSELKWAQLRNKQNRDKMVAINLFQFPPDKGNVGTAAYLDVFGSIFSVMQELKRKGYTIRVLPKRVPSRRGPRK